MQVSYGSECGSGCPTPVQRHAFFGSSQCRCAGSPSPRASFMSPSLGPQRSGEPLRPVTPFFSEGEASDAHSTASASPVRQRSAGSPGSPAGVHSPTSLTSDSARRRGSIVNVRAEFIKARKEDEPERMHTQKEKYRKIGIDVMTNSYISNLMAAVVLCLGCIFPLVVGSGMFYDGNVQRAEGCLVPKAGCLLHLRRHRCESRWGRARAGACDSLRYLSGPLHLGACGADLSTGLFCLQRLARSPGPYDCSVRLLGAVSELPGSRRFSWEPRHPARIAACQDCSADEASAADTCPPRAAQASDNDGYVPEGIALVLCFLFRHNDRLGHAHGGLNCRSNILLILLCIMDAASSNFLASS